MVASLVVPLTAADGPSTVVNKQTIGPDKCVIRGTAVTTEAIPLPNRRVRLRNLDTSAIEQVSITDKVGDFSFIALPEVPYVVEFADDPGQVLAVGPVVLARAGEVVGGGIVVPTMVPAYSSAFRSTAGALISALGGTGLTALQPPIPPLSPER
jgi:hypothetical protein